MRETRFSTRLILAAGAAAALIAAPVTVSPHALSWQVAAARMVRVSHSHWHHGNAFGHRDERGHGSAYHVSADRGPGRLQDRRGWPYGHGWGQDGNGGQGGTGDQGGTVLVDDEAPPS
jgi:hypothetical protein